MLTFILLLILLLLQFLLHLLLSLLHIRSLLLLPLLAFPSISQFTMQSSQWSFVNQTTKFSTYTFLSIRSIFSPNTFTTILTAVFESFIDSKTHLLQSIYRHKINDNYLSWIYSINKIYIHPFFDILNIHLSITSSIYTHI